MFAASVHPARCWLARRIPVGRSLGLQVAVRTGLPSRNQWQWGADSLRTIAGAATVLLCSLLGP